MARSKNDISVVIDRMIMHVVGGKPNDLEILDETPVVFADFFEHTVRVAYRTNRYYFDPQMSGSNLRNYVEKLEVNDAEFEALTKQIAHEFHDLHKENMSIGLLVCFVGKINGSFAFSVVKVDNEAAVKFAIKRKANRSEADLDLIERALVQKKETIQKCATFTRDNGEWVIHVKDRSNVEVAEYFRRFLGVKRKWDDAALTREVFQCLVKGIRDSYSLIDPEINRQAADKVREYMLGLAEFDTSEASIAAAITHITQDVPNSDVVAMVMSHIKASKVDNEIFNISSKAFPDVTGRQIVTNENIKITLSPELSEQISFDEDGEDTIIRIRTSGVKYDDRV